MSLRLLASVILLCAPTAWADGARPGPGAGTLVVQVRTNMRPSTDFDKIRVVVHGPGGRGVLLQREVAVKGGDQYRRGVRVFESRLAKRSYTFVVTALKGRDVIAQQPARVDIKGGVQVVPVPLSRAGAAPKKPSACQYQWNRDKRTCGKVLGACIKSAQGRRAVIDRCKKSHDVCVRSADRNRTKCSAKSRSKRAVKKQPRKGVAPRRR